MGTRYADLGCEARLSYTATLHHMKVFVYNYHEFDEGKYSRQFTKEADLDPAYTNKSSFPETCSLVNGSDFITIVTTPITPKMIDCFKKGGVK